MASQTTMDSSNLGLEEDIVSKILKDHELVRTLWSDYKNSNDFDFKKTCLDNIIKNIVQHSASEEMVLYNDYEKLFKNSNDGKKIAEHSWKEHEEVKKLLYEIDSNYASKLTTLSNFELLNDARLDSLLMELFSNLEHHMKEEETDYLPRLRLECDHDKLLSLGKSFDHFKLTSAPTRPHPLAPEKGLTGIIGNTLTKPLDEIRDAINPNKQLA
jgi:acetyl esterase